jgi:uncharacterized protein YcbX
VTASVGTVKTLSRFPVKSMLGEHPDVVDIIDSGIAGDRAWGLVDVETGKVASAKHPRLWAALLGMRASYAGAANDGPVRIDLPDGTSVSSDDSDVDVRLSALIGREVHLTAEVPSGASYEEEWPEVEGLAPSEFIAGTRSGRSVTGRDLSSLPVGMLAPGTFQDVAPLTLMTTASLRAARALHPDGDWDDRRFRSTLLIDCEGEDFVEQEWIGRSLRIGEVELSVAAPTPRCVMVTLPQQDLGPDAQVLRTLAKHNRLDVLGSGLYACLGVYASVVRSGRIAGGNPVELA